MMTTEETGRPKRIGIHDSHWIDYDAPRNTRQAKAACGAWVDFQTFSTAPSCEACQRAKARVDALEF